MDIKIDMLKKFVIIYKRVDAPRKHSFISTIYAKDWQDADERVLKFKTDKVYDIDVKGELNEEIIIIETEEEYSDFLNLENLDWLFLYYQKDIISPQEKQELKEFLLKEEMYEYLIDF